MKKSLIALAIAAAAPAAFAATSNIDVSGKIQAAVVNVGGSGVTATEKTVGFNNENSTITISGKEDLGGGMAVGFSLTNGLDMGSQAANFGAQNQILTLSSSAGTLLAGKFVNPMQVMARGVDLFADQVAGDARHLTYHGLSDARANNVVGYISPKFSGVTAVVAWAGTPAQAAPGAGGQTNTDAANNNDLTMWKLTYSNGPLSLGVAGHNRRIGVDEKVTRAIGSYTMGDVRVVGLYQQNDDIGGVAGSDGKTWGLGASYAMGPITLKTQYYKHDDDAAQADSNLLAIGADYSLSKRTTVQVAYGKVTNDANVARGSNNTGATFTQALAGADALTTVNGSDPTRLSIGLKHTF